MSNKDTLKRPTVDGLRKTGHWDVFLDKLHEWDPGGVEAATQMSDNPWINGVLPLKTIELICIALNAACTNLQAADTCRHIRAALEAGATRAEILEVLKLCGVRHERVQHGRAHLDGGTGAPGASGKEPSIEQERSMLKLDESLKICLLAVATRYPDSMVEINKDVLKRSYLWKGLCTVEQALEQLQVHAPHFLQASARLLIDEEQAISAIYLVDRSEEVPAMHLYCGHDHERPLRHGLHEPELRLISPD